MKKYKIGYTTGVFDLFHIGHLNILRQAKELCDYLIVGVSTDDLVASYKGKTPIIPYTDRVEIIKAIKYVDEVVPQITRDKLVAWNTYHFDCMFVGDDWKNSSIFKEIEHIFAPLGVDIIYFPYTPKVSSTLLRQELHKREKSNQK